MSQRPGGEKPPPRSFPSEELLCPLSLRGSHQERKAREDPGSDTWFRELAACSKPWGYLRAFSGPAGLLLAPSSSPEQGQVLCQMLRDYVGDPPPGITGVPCGPHWPFKQKAVVETRHIASTQCM